MSVFQGAVRVTRGDGPDLASMTKAQLQELAVSRGVEVPKSATKARLIELLEA